MTSKQLRKPPTEPRTVAGPFSTVQVPKVFPSTPMVAPASDATVALSQDALTFLVQQALDKPVSGQNSGSWGPFVAGYSLNLNVSGGSITLVDLGQQIRLDSVVVSGIINLSVGINLGAILPSICIPPTRACVTLFGHQICTPQVCISWPTISVPLTPILVPPIGLSVNFQVSAQQDGSNWDVILKVFPFSILVDLTPSVNTIIDAVESAVRNTLGQIPLIGNLIDDLVDGVLNALRAVIDAILAAIEDLLKQLIILIDLFSPTVPFRIAQIAATQKVLPAGGPGDAEVDLTISAVTPTIVTPTPPPPLPNPAPPPELVIAVNFA